MPVQLSDEEYAALKKAADKGKAASTDIEEIAKRPYRVIKNADGVVLCFPPVDGGPLTIGGQHPDDWFGAGDDGLATKHAE